MTQAPQGLALSLEPVEGELIPVQLHFQNDGAVSVRLLDLFRAETLPTIMLLDVLDDEGSPVIQGFGGGKVDPSVHTMEYVEIAPGESWSRTVHLAELLPSAIELPPGRYFLQATYLNVHGEECFTGQLTAAAVPISFESDRPREK